MPVSDNEIIERIRGGGRHHYAQLVDRYKDKAMTLAVRMLRNREDAEEASQDAFVRAYNALDKFQGTAKFSTWLYRIVYNVCLTRLGTRKNEFQQVEYEDGKTYDGSDVRVLSSAGLDFETKDMVLFVQRIVEQLPPKYGSILSLFYFQELSHEGICEITQLPLGTVKVHLHRARALLQERLQKELQIEKAV